MLNFNKKNVLLAAALCVFLSGCVNMFAYGDGVKDFYSRKYTNLGKIRKIAIFPYFLKYSEGGVPESRIWLAEFKKNPDINTDLLTIPTELTQEEFIKKLGSLSESELSEFLGEEKLPDAFPTGEVIESDYRLAPFRGWYKKYQMKVVLYNIKKQKLWEASITNDDYMDAQKFDTVRLLVKAYIDDRNAVE